MGNSQRKTFIPASPNQPIRQKDLTGLEEDDGIDTKSARVVAQQGPFVSVATTAQELRDFYVRMAPDKTEEQILRICHSGIPVAELNEKLRAKYGCDLTNYTSHPGPSSKAT